MDEIKLEKDRDKFRKQMVSDDCYLYDAGFKDYNLVNKGDIAYHAILEDTRLNKS